LRQQKGRCMQCIAVHDHAAAHQMLVSELGCYVCSASAVRCRDTALCVTCSREVDMSLLHCRMECPPDAEAPCWCLQCGIAAAQQSSSRKCMSTLCFCWLLMFLVSAILQGRCAGARLWDVACNDSIHCSTCNQPRKRITSIVLEGLACCMFGLHVLCCCSSSTLWYCC
jgi:hypothetical protein